MRTPLLFVALTVMMVAPLARADDSRSTTLTLEAALEQVLSEHPRLQAYDFEPRIADAQVRQAGARPNPELALTVEEIALGGDTVTRASEWSVSSGMGLSPLSVMPAAGYERTVEHTDSGGFAQSEWTLELTQEIETAGKRGKRIQAAEARAHVVDADHQVLRLELLSVAAQAYIDALEAQEYIALERDLVGLADNVADVFEQRVTAGKVSPIEGQRAQTAASTARLRLQAAEQRLELALLALAAAWGGNTPTFAAVAGELTAPPSLPELSALQESLAQHPAIVRWNRERKARDAAWRLAKAESAPNPTLALGLRVTGNADSAVRGWNADSSPMIGASWGSSQSEDERNVSLVVGLSVPLPFFNRNRGNIRAAELRMLQSDYEQADLRAGLAAALTRQYTRMAQASSALQRVREEVLPQAQQTFDMTEEGYRQGKFGYLEVLDAQRALFDVRTTELETLAAFHRAQVALEWIAGQPLKTWLEATTKEGTIDDE